MLLMSVVPQGDAGRREADGPGGSRQRKTVRSLLRVGVLLNGKPDRDAGRREVAGPQGISYGTIIARSSAWGYVVAAGGLGRLRPSKKIFVDWLDNGSGTGKLEGLPRSRGLRERGSARWVSVS
ncbi:hypothetical protein GCM10009735_74280 [Actinomadura chokoriensis]